MRRRCRWAFCPRTPNDNSNYCSKHVEQATKKYLAYNSLYSANKRVWDKQYQDFYNAREWRLFAKAFLAKEANVICAHCKRNFSQMVHHVKPLKEAWELRFEPSNLQGLCNPCHSRHELGHRNKLKKSI